MKVTEVDTSAPAEVDAALQKAVAPVEEQLARLDEYIAQRETELASLKATHKRAQRVLLALDPEHPRVRAKTARGKAGGAARGAQVSRERSEKRARVEEYVRARPDALISVPTANGDPLLAGISRGMLGALLADLTDAGVLRLDHIGTGNSKQYRLVA